MREVYDLNFNWLFNSENLDEHISDYSNVSGFENVDIPHNAVDIPLQYFDESKVQTTSTYKKEIYIQSDWKDKIVNLIFEGVAHIAHVFVGDEFVMTHHGGYDQFKVNVSDFVTYGRTNMITIVVNSHENVFVPPFGGPLEFLGYGGIYREVSLEVLEQNHIEDFFIKTYDPVNSSTVTLEVDLKTETGNLEVCIYDGEIEVLKTKTVVNDKHMVLKLDYNKKVLWSIYNPHLYKIVISYFVDDVLVDKASDKFGFRSAEFKNDGFYLNGELIKLKGLNRHQSYPYVGNAMPKSVQEEDADILKYDLGLNIVRSSNCPPSKHFLNRCDEIGLLVYEEIVGYNHIGAIEWQETSLNNLKQMIKRDKNHPSVILWGIRVSNSEENIPFYQETNYLAHSLDDTRQTGGSRSIKKSQLLEDVYTFDDYTYSESNYIVKKKLNAPNSPYLITAHTGPTFPTKPFENKELRLEHGLRHLNILNEVFDAKSHIAGAIGSTMADYNTHSEFGSETKIAYHGVLDIYRNPKFAAYAYASQEDREPILELTSNLYIGADINESSNMIYAYTNCEHINLYRNGEYINSFYPDFKVYPNLKHPPILIDDFIGEELEKYERLKSKDATRVKKLIKFIGSNKADIPKRVMIKIMILAQRYHMSYDKFLSMMYKYKYSNFSKDNSYRFEGIVGNVVVKNVIIEKTFETDYIIEASRKTLEISATYDAQRIVVKKVNQVGQVLTYGFDPIKVEVSGCISLIGPSLLNLNGGMVSFWVRTNGDRGTGSIKITGEVTRIESIIVK